MGKQISIGNVVEDLNRHFTCYNPVNHFRKFSENQKSSEKNIISQLEHVNNCVGNSLIQLYKDLLFYRKEASTKVIDSILECIEKKYKPLIQKLSNSLFQDVKNSYKEWRLEWMLNYIKQSELLSDREFAIENNIDTYNKEINPDAVTLMNKLRNYYYSPIELCGEYSCFVDKNDCLPESEEIV